MSRKISKISAGISAGIMAFGAVAMIAAPTFANDGAFQQVTVVTEEEIVLTGNPSDNTTLEPSATGPGVEKDASPLEVEANVDWKLEWQAVKGSQATNVAALCTDLFNSPATGVQTAGSPDGLCDSDRSPVYPATVAAADGTALGLVTATPGSGGFESYSAGTNIKYQGTNAIAASTAGDKNVWSARLVPSDGTGAATTFNFTALSPAKTMIWKGPATSTATLSPHYSADIDASLPQGTYFGTIYYVLTADV